MSRTAVPIELDNIYSSLGELTKELGPEGANKTGALSALLRAGAKALKGNGRLGNETLANLSRAVQTFGDNSDEIFGMVDNLASITSTLQANDKFVGQFMDHLAAVSTELAGERGDLRKALVAIAGAVDTVRGFVHDNRKALVTDVKQLTTTVGVLAKEKNTLAKVIQLAPLGLGNLGEAFDVRTGTVGIRLQLGPTASDLGNILCEAISVNNAAVAKEACPLLRALLPAPSANVGAGLLSSSSNPLGGLTSGAPVTGLGGLLGVKGKL
jgi:ABC-type transporter Mla subunit MlaD